MTHWKKLTNPNYLGAYSIEDGKDLILTIDRVINEMVTGTDGKKEECVVAYFRENVKPMILNTTNMKTISKVYGTPYIEDWHNKKIRVGIEKVKAFGEVVEALRVRKEKPQDEKYICESCGAEIQGYGSKSAETMAAYTKQKYGKALCSQCATKLAQTINTEVSANENN